MRKHVDWTITATVEKTDVPRVPSSMGSGDEGVLWFAVWHTWNVDPDDVIEKAACGFIEVRKDSVCFWPTGHSGLLLRDMQFICRKMKELAATARKVAP